MKPEEVEAGALALAKRSGHRNAAAHAFAYVEDAAAVILAVEPMWIVAQAARDLPPASVVVAYRDAVEADLREHLLAQAKVLSPRGVGARVVDGELVTYALVERDEVLALLEGKKPTP